MKIEVTAEDIEAGEAADCYRCPIALAGTRAGLCAPRVLANSVWFGGIKRRVAYLPKEATEFVEAFDRGESPTPFSFELDVGNSHELGKPRNK
jgi:hypothetical protein